VDHSSAFTPKSHALHGPCFSANIPLQVIKPPNFQSTKHMSDNFAKPQSVDQESGFSQSPSVSQAANDLRAAAGERAKEVAHETADQAKAMKSKALESAQQFRDAATERAQALKVTASEKATAIRQAAGEKATHLRTVADEQWHQTRDRAKDIHITTEDYIRENPTKCVLGALGIGFLIGLISRR
jgi:ElaB/YqjD/DUF883 family membrane-anchored ribosome-binding protein